MVSASACQNRNMVSLLLKDLWYVSYHMQYRITPRCHIHLKCSMLIDSMCNLGRVLDIGTNLICFTQKLLLNWCIVCLEITSVGVSKTIRKLEATKESIWKQKRVLRCECYYTTSNFVVFLLRCCTTPIFTNIIFSFLYLDLYLLGDDTSIS